MKKLIIFGFLCFSFNANADLANAIECHKVDSDQCVSLLIGTIDSLHATKSYCPDGHTSYAHIISFWKRDLDKYPFRSKSSTYQSMALTIKSLGLTCQEKK
jgi:hypothetical protein